MKGPFRAGIGSTRPNRNGEQVAPAPVGHLRLRVDELQMADVSRQVSLALHTEFENYSVSKPGDYNLDPLTTLLDQVIAWSAAPDHAPQDRRGRLTPDHAARRAENLGPAGG